MCDKNELKLPEHSSLVIESSVELYFIKGSSIPNPYPANKEDVDEVSEHTLLGENNIIAEAQALTSLILFFRDNLKKSFSDNSEDLVKNRSSRFSAATTVGLFIFISVVAVLKCGLLSRREALSPHSTVQYVTVVNKSDYDFPRKQLPAQVKKGFVLKASALLEAEQPIQARLFGGGNDALINPNEMFFPSVPRARVVRSLPKAESIRGLKAFPSSLNVSRRIPLTSSASALKAGTDNQSSLSLNRIDSSDLINVNVSDIFVGRPGNLGNRDSLLVADALKATKGNVGYNKTNLFNIQKIKGKSDLLNETDKAEWGQGMKTVLKKVCDECEEAKANLKRAQEEKASREYIKEKEEEVKKLEHKISFETAQLEYHLEYTLNSKKVTLKTHRQPGDTSHGNLSVTFQIYNQEKLTEEENKIIYNDLKLYFDGGINRIKNKTITFAKRDEFVRLAGKSLESCVDINDTRLKIANSVENEDAPENLIKWAKRQRPCLDERYKNDPFKSEPNEVDRYLLEKARLSQIR